MQQPKYYQIPFVKLGEGKFKSPSMSTLNSDIFKALCCGWTRERVEYYLRRKGHRAEKVKEVLDLYTTDPDYRPGGALIRVGNQNGVLMPNYHRDYYWWIRVPPLVVERLSSVNWPFIALVIVWDGAIDSKSLTQKFGYNRSWICNRVKALRSAGFEVKGRQVIFSVKEQEAISSARERSGDGIDGLIKSLQKITAILRAMKNKGDEV